MSTVRRVPTSSPAFYRPHLIVVESPNRPTYSAFKTLLWIGAVLVGLLLVWAGLSYWRQRFSVIQTLPSLISIQSLPPNLSNPPVYPGAQDVKLVSSQPCGKEIRFTSPDSNEQIADYYKDVLPKSGWQQPYEIYGDLFSRWIKYSLNGTQLDDYGLVISFTGYSKKEVRLIMGNCYQQQEQENLASLGKTSPTPTPPAINITRQQYDEALAKWHAAAVEEYEISVSTFAYLGGTNRLHVSKYGQEILELFPSPTPAITPDPEYIEYTKEDTVEGMFAEVERFLDSDTVIHSGAMMSTGNFYMAYTVEFDPDLGYPVRMSGHPVTEPGVAVNDADWEKTVQELTIVKKAATTP